MYKQEIERVKKAAARLDEILIEGKTTPEEVKSFLELRDLARSYLDILPFVGNEDYRRSPDANIDEIESLIGSVNDYCKMIEGLQYSEPDA